MPGSARSVIAEATETAVHEAVEPTLGLLYRQSRRLKVLQAGCIAHTGVVTMMLSVTLVAQGDLRSSGGFLAYASTHVPGWPLTVSVIGVLAGALALSGMIVFVLAREIALAVAGSVLCCAWLVGYAVLLGQAMLQTPSPHPWVPLVAYAGLSGFALISGLAPAILRDGVL